MRAKLEPLEPGERPLPLKVAAATATLLALANVGFSLAGVEVEGEAPALSGVLLFAAIMLLAAWGMWTQRYWAVLGFQALLAITLVVAALSLLVAEQSLGGRAVRLRSSRSAAGSSGASCASSGA